MNYKQVYAIKKKNTERVLKANKDIKDESGIYFLTRCDENGINYFYIGQSVTVLSRMVSHLSGFQHIDISLKKRDFYSKDNPYGWKLNVIYYPKDILDEMEQYWILEYTKRGYQCRYNKTGGGQGEGKEKINEFRPAKGYRDGIRQGRKTMARDIKTLFDKHLDVKTKDIPPSRYQSAALEKFQNLLSEGDVENVRTE